MAKLLVLLLAAFASAAPYRHVVVIGVDGFGSLFLNNATNMLPTFARLIQEGCSTMTCRDQHPTISAPNWASMTTGMMVTDHGILTNDWDISWASDSDITILDRLPPVSGADAVPETMWALLKEKLPTATTAVSTSWPWVLRLCTPKTCDLTFNGDEDDQKVTDAVVSWVTSGKTAPTLTFVHLDEVDEAGHEYGWGSVQFYDVVKLQDSRIAQMIAAYEKAGIADQTLFIVSADHGGFRTVHGQFSQCNAFIPVIAYGSSVPRGAVIPVGSSILDIPATALHALGIAPGRFMRGRAIPEIFGA